MTELIFTDGACIGNGKSTAKASYAVVTNNISINGLVEPYEYIMNNNKLDVNRTKKINPSNNRGELLGIIHALLLILHAPSPKNYIIYSDSMICINTINSWYDNRKRKGTLKEFKNLDLLDIMMTLKETAKERHINVLYMHTRSHQKKPTDPEKLIIWLGNDKADKLAEELLK
jgi:ribonuclease HI